MNIGNKGIEIIRKGEHLTSFTVNSVIFLLIYYHGHGKLQRLV
jgi:hypothetical protein